ncbi:hypothetical protein [Streptomyces sp. NBC_01314]|uniref:hypothetical protein n=1 Tax=Streptomyces sp. NBC_01314 TaxID=2903821 RepID=UPI003091F676|nr:hypothetical protein OG622_43360 [Streptomyces sp. NBC_01314]
MTDTAAVEILADVHRGVGRILLNRPKALNALTTDMVTAIDVCSPRGRTHRCPLC